LERLNSGKIKIVLNAYDAKLVLEYNPEITIDELFTDLNEKYLHAQSRWMEEEYRD